MTERSQDQCVVLVVETDPELRGMLLEALESWGIEARQAETLATAVPASLTWGPFEAIICGQTLPDGTGTVFLRWLRDQVIGVPFLLLSDHAPSDLRNSSRFGFLRKPFSAAELRTALERLLPSAMERDHQPAAVGTGEGVGILAEGARGVPFEQGIS